MLGYGSLVGIAVVNFLSDYQGRKFSVMLALTVQVGSITRTLTAISVLFIGSKLASFPILVVSEFMAGFSTISLLSVSYALSDKLMSKKWMSRSVLVTNGFSYIIF